MGEAKTDEQYRQNRARKAVNRLEDDYGFLARLVDAHENHIVEVDSLEEDALKRNKEFVEEVELILADFYQTVHVPSMPLRSRTKVKRSAKYEKAFYKQFEKWLIVEQCKKSKDSCDPSLSFWVFVSHVDGRGTPAGLRSAYQRAKKDNMRDFFEDTLMQALAILNTSAPRQVLEAAASIVKFAHISNVDRRQKATRIDS